MKLRDLVLLASLPAVACAAPTTGSTEVTGEAREALYTPKNVVEEPADAEPREWAPTNPSGRGSLPALRGFYFVVQQGAPYLVIDVPSDFEQRPATAIPYEPGDFSLAAWAPFDGDRSALGDRAAEGREVVLYGDEGALCFGTTRAPVYLYRAEPFEFQGDAGERFATELNEGQRTPSSTLIALPLDVKGGDCRHTSWARPSALTPPRLYVSDGDSVEVSGDGTSEAPWASAALATTRRTGEYAATQRLWNEALSHETEPFLRARAGQLWDGGPTDRSFRTVQRFELDDGGDSISVVEIAGFGGCSDCDFRLWSAVRGSMEIASTREAWGPRALVDIDDDGVFEILGDDMLLVRDGEEWAVFEVPAAFWVCPA